MQPDSRFDAEFWKVFRKEGLLKYTSKEKAAKINDLGGETLGGMSFVERPDWKGWPVVRELQAKGFFEAVLAAPDSMEAKLLVQLLKDDYQAHYWDALGLPQMPDPLAGVAFDMAVNQGPAAMGLCLQKLLNAFNRQGTDYADVREDGDPGPATITALRCFITQRGSEGVDVLAAGLLGCRVGLYLDLVRRKPEQEDNFYGWIRARVASFFNLK